MCLTICKQLHLDRVRSLAVLVIIVFPLLRYFNISFIFILLCIIKYRSTFYLLSACLIFVIAKYFNVRTRNL